MYFWLNVVSRDLQTWGTERLDKLLKHSATSEPTKNAKKTEALSDTKEKVIFCWPERPPVEELLTSSWPSDGPLPPARWSPESAQKTDVWSDSRWVRGKRQLCVQTQQEPLSQWSAAWSFCRCRKAPLPREPHASRPHAWCPGSCHVSSGSSGTQWNSGSGEGSREWAVPTQRFEKMWSLFEDVWRKNLVVLEQNDAEVELAEGELQVLDVVVFAALLLGEVEHGLALPQAGRSVALPLSVQRRLQLILQSCKSPLCFS